MGASDKLSMCNRTIDGSAVGGTINYEWYPTGGGVGLWVKIQFARPYLINTIRVKQRSSAAEQNKGLKLTFMDSSEAYVSNSSVYYIYLLHATSWVQDI